MLSWSLYAILGFAPSVLIAVTGVRALRRDTASAWADCRDASELCGWAMPGLAVLAAVCLPVGDGLSVVQQVLLCVLTWAVFGTLVVLFYSARYHRLLIERPALAQAIWRTLGWWARRLGPIAVVGIGLVLPVLDADRQYQLSVSGWTFLRVTVGLLIGSTIFSLGNRNRGWVPGRARMLAPCELASRAGEIASRLGIDILELRVYTEVPFVWAGGCAFSPSQIALTEDLVRRLRREEVDAVLIHEVAHAQARWRWWLYGPAGLANWLLPLVCAFAMERLIVGLPQPLLVLHYVLWLSLFIVPKLAWVRYVRHGEEAANAQASARVEPTAFLSSMFKLAIIDQWPVDRPWWSRLISTHPTPREEAEKIAREYGLADEQLKHVESVAERELAEHAGEYYDLVFQEESREQAMARPGRRGYQTALGVAGGGIVVLIFAGLAVADSLGAGTALTVVVAMASAAVTACVAFPVICRFRARQLGRFRQQAREELRSRYPAAREADMLLVDAVMMRDWDSETWQAAMLGIDGEEMVVLGELGEQRIPVASITGLSRYSQAKSPNGPVANDSAVVVWYEEGGASQWLLVRNLGRPEKGLPRGCRQLERYLRERLKAVGAGLRFEEAEGPLRIRRILVRGLAAICVLVAITALAYWAMRLAGIECSLVGPAAFALVCSGEALWSWVTDRKRPPRA